MNRRVIIQFGGTGNLAKQKLLPAYKKLHKVYSFCLLCLGKENISNKDYLKNMVDNPKDYHFLNYKKCDLKDLKDKNVINDYIGTKNPKEVIFYIALDPSLHELALNKISEALFIFKNIKKKIVIEKPFGSNIKSSEKYNKIISRIFSEKEIYRVDHYLGKSFVQNLSTMRFENNMLQKIWNKDYIEHVQIVIDEDKDISQRIDSYKKIGVIRDMLQNHILQIITHLTMNKPLRYTQKHISREKMKILKSIKSIKDYRLGKYKSLLVKNNFNTSTFVVLKLFIENFSFSGIPFYVRTGKKMKKSALSICVKFKKFSKKSEKQKLLTLKRIISKVLNNKKSNFYLRFSDKFQKIGSAHLVFNYKKSKNIPRAYEEIIGKIIEGNKSIFPKFKEIKKAWKIVSPLLDKKEIKIYQDGKLPEFAEKFIQRDKKIWHI